MYDSTLYGKDNKYDVMLDKKRREIQAASGFESGGKVPRAYDPAGHVAVQLDAIRNGSLPNPVSAEFLNSSKPITARLQDHTESKEASRVVLEKILGGPNPYPELETPRKVAEVNDKVKELETIKGKGDHTIGGSAGTGDGTTVPDAGEVGSGSLTELLMSILGTDVGARASEDVMGQYAAMTGGRPSSAAISAGTAAKADAEAALLRELLSSVSGNGTGSGGSVLSSLLSGGEAQQTGGDISEDIPEEYADFADLAGYGTIVPVLEQMDNNANMASYLADMVNKNVIDDATALEYLNRFEDVYEVTGLGGAPDYASMVQNVGGWTAVTDGGGNRPGTIDRNAKVKAPTGETLTLAQLYRILKKNGMEKDEARAYIVKLQNHLGI